MVNPDRYLARLAEEHMAESEDDLEEKIIEAIKKEETVKYGHRNQYTIDPSDSDLYDKVAQMQKQMMLAYANDDDKLLLKLIKIACKMEIDSLMNLIGD